MDMSVKDLSNNSPSANYREKASQCKGIRLRKWGKWVAEVRMPKCRDKIWLGSYNTAEQAARAYDAAVYCLRGPSAKFNFPDSIPAIPSASSLSRKQIQVAAAKYALEQIPSNSNLENLLTEKLESPSRSSSVSELESASYSQVVFEEEDPLLWESLFGDSNCNQSLNLDNLPTWDLISATEEQGSFVFDLTDLWSF